MKTKDLSIHVIEDDLAFNKLVCLMLKSMGFQNVKSYNSALNYLSSSAYNENPDVAILDYHFDNIKGTQVLDKIKSSGNSTEVVMISAFFNEAKILTVEQLKAFAAIAKNNNFVEKLKLTFKKIQHLVSKN